MSAEVRIETISRLRDFARLGGSWDELVRSMRRPSPFLLHDWLLEWWCHYGAKRTLAVHVAKRGERLVGALPMCRTRRLGLRVTEFLGGTGAPLADLLLAPGEDRDTAVQLAARITMVGVDYADLFGMPGDSRLEAVVPQESLTLIERQEAPVLDLSGDWEAIYKDKLSSKHRSERRRHRRRLEELGVVDVSLARTPNELVPALEDTVRIHALRWKGRRETSGFSKPIGSAFRRAALLRLAQQGLTRVVTLRLDQQAIAFAIYILYERTTYGVTMGFDPQLPSASSFSGQTPPTNERSPTASSRSTKESALPRPYVAEPRSRRLRGESGSAGGSSGRGRREGSSTTSRNSGEASS
jgi:CelD/BcsL family acetyltransferase involved in cellulose biosynthesis